MTKFETLNRDYFMRIYKIFDKIDEKGEFKKFEYSSLPKIELSDDIELINFTNGENNAPMDIKLSTTVLLEWGFGKHLENNNITLKDFDPRLSKETWSFSSKSFNQLVRFLVLSINKVLISNPSHHKQTDIYKNTISKIKEGTFGYDNLIEYFKKNK